MKNFMDNLAACKDHYQWRLVQRTSISIVMDGAALVGTNPCFIGEPCRIWGRSREESDTKDYTPALAVASYLGVPLSRGNVGEAFGRSLGLWSYQVNSIVAACEMMVHHPTYNVELRREILTLLGLQ